MTSILDGYNRAEMKSVAKYIYIYMQKGFKGTKSSYRRAKSWYFIMCFGIRRAKSSYFIVHFGIGCAKSSYFIVFVGITGAHIYLVISILDSYSCIEVEAVTNASLRAEEVIKYLTLTGLSSVLSSVHPHPTSTLSERYSSIDMLFLVYLNALRVVRHRAVYSAACNS